MPSTLKAARMHEDTIHKCPICGSEKTNQVSWSNYYCMDCCDLEFNTKTGEVYTIDYNGELVPYYINEFMDCG